MNTKTISFLSKQQGCRRLEYSLDYEGEHAARMQVRLIFLEACYFENVPVEDCPCLVLTYEEQPLGWYASADLVLPYGFPADMVELAQPFLPMAAITQEEAYARLQEFHRLVDAEPCLGASLH